MELLNSWLSAERGRGVALARQLGVPASFVSKMAAGYKPIPLEHAAQIEAFTGGAVTRRDIFPDTYERIWPELASSESPTAQPAGEGVAHG